MDDLTSAEPTVDVRVESQLDETILSPQRQDKFWSMSPEAQQNLNTQQTQAPSTASGEGTSFITLTPK